MIVVICLIAFFSFLGGCIFRSENNRDDQIIGKGLICIGLILSAWAIPSIIFYASHCHDQHYEVVPLYNIEQVGKIYIFKFDTHSFGQDYIGWRWHSKTKPGEKMLLKVTRQILWVYGIYWGQHTSIERVEE